eukprot:TRINITY_DN8384_c0_g1_i4.p1 TRINITY_DN8384_c0_g1~~TRINITY_DN8384_c0_g1_i4.p1  ORF type:complete len:776 (+),score=138.37 TRINITY_DN8384_c0_g1_i4:49-2328(+)
MAIPTPCRGRTALFDYLSNTISRLQTSPVMNPVELRAKVMPSVAGSIKRLSAGAPAELKKDIDDVLVSARVLPDYEADIEEFQEALLRLETMFGAVDKSPCGPPHSPKTGVRSDEEQKPLTRQNTMGHRLRGISVNCFVNSFVAEVLEGDLTRDATVADAEPVVIRPKGAAVVCPRDGRLGAAYVDCLDSKDASMSTHMLSYTWGYKVGDIADSLAQFCSMNNIAQEDTYFWMCCVCINQHRVKEAQDNKETVPFEQFREEFADRVSSIGHVVAMMAPWFDPVYTKRVWCDFEMYTAASMGPDKCKISVIMPPAEAADMRDTLTSGPISNPKMWEALQQVKVEDAQASVEEDKVRILDLIESSTGFHALNSTVAKCLRDWIVGACDDVLSRLDAELDAGSVSSQVAAKTWARLGCVLRDTHNNERALAALTRATSLFKTSGLTDSLDWACLMSNLGSSKRRNGDLDGALEALCRAERIFTRIEQTRTVEYAMCCNTLGAAERAKGDRVQAMGTFEKGLHILHEIGEYDSQECCSILLSFGALKRDFGDASGALDSFNEACDILKKIDRAGIPLYGLLLSSIGGIKRQEKDFAGALEALEAAKRVGERLGTHESESGAGLLLSIGSVKKQMRDFHGATEAHEMARRICEKANLMDTDTGRRVQDVLSGKGKGGKGGKHGKGKCFEGDEVSTSGGISPAGKSSGSKGTHFGMGGKHGAKSGKGGKGGKARGSHPASWGAGSDGAQKSLGKGEFMCDASAPQ